MKKIFLMLLLVVNISAAFAQYRDVTLPQRPSNDGYKDYDRSGSTPFWFSIETEGASSIMEKSKNMQFASLQLTGGYRINEFLRVGVGFGGRMYVNNYEVRDGDRQFGIPVYANARGNFVSAYDRQDVPYWSVNLGGVTGEGLYFNPTIGYSFGGLRNTFLIGLSYTLSNFKDYAKDNRTYSYFGVKLGYEF